MWSVCSLCVRLLRAGVLIKYELPYVLVSLCVRCPRPASDTSEISRPFWSCSELSKPSLPPSHALRSFSAFSAPLSREKEACAGYDLERSDVRVFDISSAQTLWSATSSVISNTEWLQSTLESLRAYYTKRLRLCSVLECCQAG